MAGAGMIHIVDDEEAIRDALSFLFTSRGVDARGWPSGEAFLAAQPLADCACIILDVRMGELNGPETFQRLRALENTAPAAGNDDQASDEAVTCALDGVAQISLIVKPRWPSVHSDPSRPRRSRLHPQW